MRPLRDSLPDLGLPWRLLGLARKRRKDRKRAERGDAGRPTRITDVYRKLVRRGFPRARRALWRLRSGPLSPRPWLDAVVATAWLRWAEGDARRLAAVTRFASKWYDPEDLDRGLARAARRFRVLERAGLRPSGPVRAARSAADWSSFIAAGTAAVGTPSSPSHAPRPAPRSRSRRRDPVVLHMTGGLGNQLFQYAAGKSYALRVGADLLLDVEEYERPRAPREFLLDRFRVDARRASLLEVARAQRRSHRQPAAGHDAAVVEGRPGVRWLAGYWEHPLHFEGFDAEVSEWFRPRDEALAARALAWVESLRAPGEEIVGLHVRRGDRVQGRPDSVPHRALPLEYYLRAVAQFPPDARFLVFSDGPSDIDWCRGHLGLPPDRTAYAEGTDPVFDLVAMAACDHLVIAASTYSWWAAWLGRRAGRRVVVPDPTVASGPVQMDSARPTRRLPEWTMVTFPSPDRGLFHTPRTRAARVGDGAVT